jgi:hypothetical protein
VILHPDLRVYARESKKIIFSYRIISLRDSAKIRIRCEEPNGPYIYVILISSPFCHFQGKQCAKVGPSMGPSHMRQKYLLAEPTWPKRPKRLPKSHFRRERRRVASKEMGGAAVAVLAAATATRQNRAPLASLLTRVVRGLHDASVAAAAAEEDKAGAGSRRRRRRSSSSLLLGPDFLDTWDLPPRAASRTPPPQDGGGEWELLVW